MAAISVKSSFTCDTMNRAFAELSTISLVLAPGATRRLWLGIYFFDTDNAPIKIDTALRHVCEHDIGTVGAASFTSVVAPRRPRRPARSL
jgi:hypothetical protein